jgi:hypothetical protein
MPGDRALPLIARDVLAADLADEAILLEMRGKRYFRLNATGQRIWQLLLDGVDRSALVRALVEEFDVGEGEASAELERFLDELGRHGLLQPGDADS